MKQTKGMSNLRKALEEARAFVAAEADNRSAAGAPSSDYEREPRELLSRIDAALAEPAPGEEPVAWTRDDLAIGLAAPGMETSAEERAELAQHLRYVNATGYGSDASVARYEAIQRDFDRLLADFDRAFAAGREAEREACAQLAERQIGRYSEGKSAVDVRLSLTRGYRWRDGPKIAAAIRGRAAHSPDTEAR